MSTTASHQPYLYSLPSRARNEKLDTSITTCMWVLTTRSVVLHSLTMPAHLACQPHMHCRPILLERDCIAAVGNLQILEWHRGFMHREIEVSTSSVQTFSIQVDVVSPLSSPAIYWQSPYINRMRFQASVADEVRYRSIVFSLTLHWWWVVRRSFTMASLIIACSLPTTSLDSSLPLSLVSSIRPWRRVLLSTPPVEILLLGRAIIPFNV